MKKITIPEDLKGKELIKFLIANKDALIAQKKMMIKTTEPVTYQPALISAVEGDTEKSEGAPGKEVNTDVLRVKVVANTALWCDSQMDVLLPDNAKRSIKERKGLIPHIKDHKWSVEAHVGDVVSIYYQDISLKELGIQKSGSAQALVFETEIRRSYDEKVFNLYKSGKIKQHSIGLWYVKIELAVNDEEYEKEMDFWNKYIDQIINKEVAEEKGYFWVVSEIKLLENSAVLFGSNILTPTLEMDSEESKGITEQPPVGTAGESHKTKPVESQEPSWDRISGLKFLNL